MIKPDFWNDEKLGKEAEAIQLTFIATWNFSDDYGVVRANPVWLKNQIFPYKENLRIEAFSKWLDALERMEMLIKFTVRGEQYYFIRTFRLHQSVEKPSKSRNCTEEELNMSLTSLGFVKQQDNSWKKVGEESGNSRVVVGDKEKLSINGSKVNGAKALVVASAPPADDQADLKKEYQQLVKDFQEKLPKDRWLTVRDFIRDKKPSFIEPYFDAWNIFAINIQLNKEPQTITDKRRKKFNTRIQEPEFKNRFLEILEKIKTSSFAKGDNSRGWKIGIEFILESQENYSKILENRYDF